MMRASVADTDALRQSASDLIAKQYLTAGYGHHTAPTGRQSLTLVVCDPEVIGTLTVTFDGPDGLLVDQAYGGFLKDRREVGGKCAEITKFAFQPGIRSLPAMDAVFRLAIKIMQDHDVTDLFIEVNPDDAEFYERRLRFWVIGPPTVTERVNAPARLLWVDLRLLAISIDRRARVRATPDRRKNAAVGQ